MPAIMEYFPPLVLALNEETKKHPLLLAELSRLQATNGSLPMEIMIGVVAAYCDVMLKDYYMEEDIENLLHLLLKRLQVISKTVVH